MKPVEGHVPRTLEAIDHCIAEGGSFILDRADEKLAEARRQRKESYAALTKAAEDIARSLYASKASETSQVIKLTHFSACSPNDNAMSQKSHR